MKKNIFSTLIFSFLVLPIFVLAVDTPVLPMAFYGQATINGANISVGTKIRAYNSSGTRIDQGEITATTVGLYGTDNIATANPAESRLLVVGSGTIYFKAIISGYNSGNEITAAETQAFVAGDVMRKDLTFTVCTIISVANGTVSAYPNCTITCNSGYALSGSTCVASGSGGSSGSSGSSSSSSATQQITTSPATKPISQMTVTELKVEIARILTLISQLQAEIAKLTGTATAAATAFTTDLEFKMTGSEVKRLQEFLISKGYLETGLNTGNYYSKTVGAVKAYQSAKGIAPVAGYFGPKTRAAANADLGVTP